MAWIIHNGILQDENEPSIALNNRAFSYGDGVFETMRVVNGNLHLWDNHKMRIKKSLRTLSMEQPLAVTENRIPEEIGQLMADNNTGGDVRVRLSIYRQEGGLYSPTHTATEYTLQVMPLNEEKFTMNRRGLLVHTLNEPLKVPNQLATIKSTSALHYIYAGIQKQREGMDDLLITNCYGRIIEGLSSNLFLVRDGALFTPSLHEGCVAGVMREHIIQLARHEGYETHETHLHQEAPFFADELILTNAVKGIQWAGMHSSKQYGNKTANHLTSVLNEAIPKHAEKIC